MSPAANDAVVILGQQIRLARRDHNWTARELAARAGVSERTVLAAEAGTAATSIGNVFNVAIAAGVPLFATTDVDELARTRFRGQEKIALIPSRVVHSRKAVDVSTDF
jgi:transcriptional regulator with XRE-family HTH domain